MDKSVIQWKWSNGIPYKKSARIEKEKEEYFESQVKEAVFMDSIPNLQESDQFTRISKKREEQNDKLSMRDLVAQTSVNPFLKNTNYVEDLSTQDEFLRPKDSNN